MSTSPTIRGRDVELAVIGDRVRDARRGMGSTVLVEAAAGFGKTRLLAEAARVAGEEQFAVASAIADPGDQNMTFVPMAQLIAALVETRTARRLPAGPRRRRRRRAHPAGTALPGRVVAARRQRLGPLRPENPEGHPAYGEGAGRLRLRVRAGFRPWSARAGDADRAHRAAAQVGLRRLVRTLHVVELPAGPDDIADTAGHLAGAYGATDRTLVLIRPDGYVALISDAGDVSAVSDFLAAIG
jgi:hypothetical protein